MISPNITMGDKFKDMRPLIFTIVGDENHGGNALAKVFSDNDRDWCMQQKILVHFSIA